MVIKALVARIIESAVNVSRKYESREARLKYADSKLTLATGLFSSAVLGAIAAFPLEVQPSFTAALGLSFTIGLGALCREIGLKIYDNEHRVEQVVRSE